MTLTEALQTIAAGSLMEPAAINMCAEPWRALHRLGLLHTERVVSRRRRRPRRVRVEVDLNAIGWGVLLVLQRARTALECGEPYPGFARGLRADLEDVDRIPPTRDLLETRIARMEAETSAGRCRSPRHPIGHHAHGVHLG